MHSLFCKASIFPESRTERLDDQLTPFDNDFHNTTNAVAPATILAQICNYNRRNSQAREVCGRKAVGFKIFVPLRSAKEPRNGDIFRFPTVNLLFLPIESRPGCRVYDDKLRSGERDRFHETVHESRHRNSV